MQQLSYQYRKDALKRLLCSVESHEDDILAALKSDLNKSRTEGYLTEIGVLKGEIKFVLKRLHRWMKKIPVRTSLGLFPASCYRIPEPYGNVLIMSPWNYPLLLTLEPLVGAIAAGNTVTLKPSAYSPATSQIIATIVAECFTPEVCSVVLGGRAENAGLLEQQFDYIFFTGGANVGRLVMESAAKHLTPMSLELGGKSPVIVDENCDVVLAAKRIVFGKLINAGQTCVAPDYILVSKNLKEELISKLQYYIDKFYPLQPDGTIADYPKIVNEKHFDRLCSLIAGEKIVSRQFSGILSGGELTPEGVGIACRQTLTIMPIILPDVEADSAVMQEELFGPILPILTYEDLDSAMDFVRKRPKPLALYLFTLDHTIRDKVVGELSFGGGCVNDTLMHVATSHLPFGGVGRSGMGAYHGKASFDTFTHYKSIVEKSVLIDPSVRYRPYSRLKEKLIKKLL